jgi:hypothetical protein
VEGEFGERGTRAGRMSGAAGEGKKPRGRRVGTEMIGGKDDIEKSTEKKSRMTQRVKTWRRMCRGWGGDGGWGGGGRTRSGGKKSKRIERYT